MPAAQPFRPSQVWECQSRNCDYTKRKEKPGASEGSRAIMDCPDHGAVLFECIEAETTDSSTFPS